MFKRNQLVAIEIPEVLSIIGPEKVTYANKEYFRIKGSDIRWSQKTHKALAEGRINNEFYILDGNVCCSDKYWRKYYFVKVHPYSDKIKAKKTAYDRYLSIIELISNFDYDRNSLLNSIGTQSKQKQLNEIFELLERVDSIWPEK